MPTEKQRKHNRVHSVERKLRKKQDALIKDYLKEAKRSFDKNDLASSAKIYKKLFALLEERCKSEQDKQQYKKHGKPRT